MPYSIGLPHRGPDSHSPLRKGDSGAQSIATRLAACVSPLTSLGMPAGQDGPLIHLGFCKPVRDLAPRRGG